MDADKMQKSRSNVRPFKTQELALDLEQGFIELIHQRVGMLVKFNQREVHKAVFTACDKFQLTPMEYLDQLHHVEDDSPLLVHLVNAITIGETYFFRDSLQVKLLTETLLPALIKRKLAAQDRSLRIWSAGCSSGDEIYTIVMLLKKLLPDIDRWDCHLLATDINIDALKKGMSGVYSEWSMRSIPEDYLHRYFIKQGKTYRLSDDIKRRVTFDYLNLVGDAYPAIMNGTASQDLIICRNVLIYFDDHHIKSILSRLVKSLHDDGIIMLGASDPIAMLDTDIEIYNGLPSIFTKKLKNSSAPIVKSVDCAPAAMIEPLLPKRDELAPTILPDLQVDIEDWLREGKWLEIIDYVDQMTNAEDSASLLNAKALALANMGRIPEAITACVASLNLDKMNKETYYLYGLILAENKQFKDAESAFRKALYIDQHYLMCYYQLGLLLIRHGRSAEGLKSLENAMAAVAKFDANAIVPNSNQITYAQLAGILQAEFALHQQKK